MRALLPASAALVAGALFFGDGSSSGRLFWIGGGAFLVAGAAGAAALAGLLPLPRLRREGVLFFSLLAAFVLWNGFSITWSIEPDRSWDYFNRGLVYVAFAAVGLFLARSTRAVAFGLAGLIGGVAVWALLGKVFPALYDDYGRVARLRSPVGYWNALALLLDTGLPLALWVASVRRAPWLRAAGVLVAYALLAALPLTYSRGGIALGVAVVVGWALLAEERLEGLAALAVAAVPAAVVAGAAFALPGVTDDGQSHAVRTHDGAIFGSALAAGGVVVFAIAHWLARRPPLEPGRRHRLTRIAVAGLGVVVAAGAIAYAAATGPSDWGREFRNPVSEQLSQSSGRLTTLNSSNRWFWWQEAWEAFKDDPLKGSGAGSFDLTHRLLRTNELVATEPHNLPLQFMSELGIVGFLLAAAAAAAALLGLWRALATRHEERPARVALALGAPAYLAYSVVDFDWDFVAVTGPLFLVLGVLLGRPGARAPRRSLLAAGAVLAALAAVYSIGAPWLAARMVDQAYDTLGRTRAVELARQAHNLNPLSVEPLIAWAYANYELGEPLAARHQLVRAVDVQPENWRPWYELGVFELDALREPCIAYFHLNRAYTLDSRGLPGQPKGPLDRARAIVNRGGCARP